MVPKIFEPLKFFCTCERRTHLHQLPTCNSLPPQGHYDKGDGRVVRGCWVNFQCRGVLLIWIRVGQGPTALAVGAGGGCLDIFSQARLSFLSSVSLSLGDGPI